MKLNENCDDEYCPGWGIFDTNKGFLIQSCDVCNKSKPDDESGLDAQDWFDRHKRIDLDDVKLRKDSWDRLARVVGAFAMAKRLDCLNELPELNEMGFMFGIFAGDDKEIIEMCDDFMNRAMLALKLAEERKKHAKET